jgi:hypothetical protein
MAPPPKPRRVRWGHVLDAAREIVAEYDTRMTVRQLFYRLVAGQHLPNTPGYYRGLSWYTAIARREGTFPALADDSREFDGHFRGDTSPADALDDALDDVVRYYRRDHTEGQPQSIYLAVEKRGMVSQLRAWFGDLDVPIVALGGFASQTLCDAVVRDVQERNRPAILLYAGDHDPSGHDIQRDFVARTDCWKQVRRIALSAEQVAEYRLPEYAPTDAELKKLRDDPRAKAFAAQYGSLVQYELDALAPADLRALYEAAVAEYWDADAAEAVQVRERRERAQLAQVARQLRGSQ